MVCGQGGLSGLNIGSRRFFGLGMQGKPDGYSVVNILEGSFTEEGKVAGKVIFEGGFKFEDSQARKRFERIYSAVQRQEERSEYPSTLENLKLEGKIKPYSTGKQLRIDQGVTRE